MHPMTVNAINDHYTTRSSNTQSITIIFTISLLSVLTTPLYYLIINTINPEKSTMLTMIVFTINIIIIVASYITLQYDIKYCQKPHFTSYSTIYYYYQEMFNNSYEKENFYRQLSSLCLQYNEEEKESILEQISFLLYQVDNQYFNRQLSQLEKELKYHSDLIDF